jgi:hypothetical protein
MPERKEECVKQKKFLRVSQVTMDIDAKTSNREVYKKKNEYEE